MCQPGCLVRGRGHTDLLNDFDEYLLLERIGPSLSGGLVLYYFPLLWIGFYVIVKAWRPVPPTLIDLIIIRNSSVKFYFRSDYLYDFKLR